MKKILEKSEIIFAAVLLISFFLPWADLFFICFGFQVPLLLQEYPSYHTETAKASLIIKLLSYLFYLIYLIPILSSLVIIQRIRKRNTKIISITTGLIPYLLFIYILITRTQVFSGLLFGAWLTLISALGLIISALILNNKKVKT